MKGPLIAAAMLAAAHCARAEQFDIQKYFEERAKTGGEAAAGGGGNAPSIPRPLTGGAYDIGTATYWAWIVAGAAACVAGAVVLIWMKTPAHHFAPRVDDAIEREFREMVREFGGDPDGRMDDQAQPRGAAVRESDVIEDLSGEREGPPADAGTGR